MIFIVYFLNLL